MTLQEKDGAKVRFIVPGLDKLCETWYKIFGDLNSPKVLLIILHRGPGACHDYLLPLKQLAEYVPVIFYDQIGYGHSTHLSEKNGDEAFGQFSYSVMNSITYSPISDYQTAKSTSMGIYGAECSERNGPEQTAMPANFDA